MTAEQNDVGKVYLVGAGPGDPELISVRGQRLLESADTVVYDNLIPPELIISLPPETALIYVGKKASDHALPQDEINALLVQLAREGKTVVRLKGADPLIFGRGGEEAAYLKQHGIVYEIIPGITAAIGAAACTGIPCTDRTRASLVTFATGHKAKDKDVSSVPWDDLARLKNGTLVIYMGVGEVAGIVSQLIDGGMSPDRPAAIIERGTLPTQRRVIGTLGTLPDLVQQESIRPPALFMIGETVELHSTLDWYGGKALSGLRVMVLRPADQAGSVYHELRELGAEVLPYPTIATREVVDDNAWSKIKRLSGSHRWLLFTSENGVRYFMRQLAEKVGDVRHLAAYRIAAVGYGTARALREHALTADFIPTKATVARLASELCETYSLAGAEVVRVQGNLSDNTVYDTLTAAGASVLPLEVYHTYHPEWPDEYRNRLFDFPPDVILFSSGSTAEGLVQKFSVGELARLTEKAVLVSIGPSTSAMIESYGLKVTVEAAEHSLPGVIEALVSYFTKEKQG
ncbi:MAG TPA: uroporphyrinogen-III C-methyltransferase [candidate division Zixibacteria bacterium]|nr:uroporphyrinogen-III C-methyltransferase [candidate division Zixibacteria bacterium]